MHHNKRITFISDQMKEIPHALRRAWTSPHSHLYCLRHIIDNFQNKFKDKILHNLLWEAGCATDPKVYKAKIVELKAACETADTWIENSLKIENNNEHYQGTRTSIMHDDYKCLRELQRCVERSSSFINTSANCKNIFLLS